jgi:hypothetical protein
MGGGDIISVQKCSVNQRAEAVMKFDTVMQSYRDSTVKRREHLRVIKKM